SAKLRAATRLDAPAGAADFTLFGLPKLPAPGRGAERS
ncbi:MAG: 16S rRNA (cytosine(1402)-N(4))-methyltransferase, partial [Nitratireductor sp.]